MDILIYGAALSFGLALELFVDAKGRSGILFLGKPLASTMFLVVAVSLGALQTSYGQSIFSGLVLSWFGDMFLIPKGAKGWFLAGLVSFLLGHVAYVLAFILYGGELSVFYWSLGVVVGPAGIVLRWLWPHLGAAMRGPVIAYVVVISTMVGAAVMAFESKGQVVIIAGAVLFYLSDLFVARHRFVKTERLNRVIGLPLYYAGQFLLALSVAQAV